MFISDSSKNGWKFSEFVFCWFCWFILLHHTTKFNTNRTYSHTTQLRGLLENFIDIFHRTINRLWLNGVLFESALSTTRKRDKKNWRTRKIRANSKDRNSKEQIRIIERSQCDTNSFFLLHSTITCGYGSNNLNEKDINWNGILRDADKRWYFRFNVNGIWIIYGALITMWSLRYSTLYMDSVVVWWIYRDYDTLNDWWCVIAFV